MLARSNKYSLAFAGFIVSVLVSFILVRPLHSPWHPFIAGDGLGYYSYLPARFIHGDPNYDFKWFNRVYNANYVYSTFPNPEDNLLVKYGDKRINKYYPGLSFVWMPFFAAGHITSKTLHYPADGFSWPYQLCIGLASVFYLIIGLLYLRKLIDKLFGQGWAGVVVPAAVFYGTFLFKYAVFSNSLSHSYSFTFNILFLYFICNYLRESSNRNKYLLLAIFFYAITVSIRPLNMLVVFLAPAFITGGGIKRVLPGRLELKWQHVAILGLITLLLWYHFYVMFNQTGSLFPYTYSNERFYFSKNKFFDGLFSYHIGIFVYIPLFALSLWGLKFVNRRLRIILPAGFFGLLFLYSSWWYWPIMQRAMIDYYVIPALLLGALISGVSRARLLVLALMFFSVIYHQLKEMQVRRGILDEYATYDEVFWRNFFVTEKTNSYAVPPSTILGKEQHEEDFEDLRFRRRGSSDQFFSGSHSLLLDSVSYINGFSEFNYPAVFNRVGFRKVRFSFHCFFERNINSAHAFILFYDSAHKVILEAPFYLNADDIHPGRWDFKEFGYEIADTVKINSRTVKKIGFTIWNVEGKSRLFIDDAKMEFLLTGRSFETIQ